MWLSGMTDRTVQSRVFYGRVHTWVFGSVLNQVWFELSVHATLKGAFAETVSRRRFYFYLASSILQNWTCHAEWTGKSNQKRNCSVRARTFHTGVESSWSEHAHNDQPAAGSLVMQRPCSYNVTQHTVKCVGSEFDSGSVLVWTHQS